MNFLKVNGQSANLIFLLGGTKCEAVVARLVRPERPFESIQHLMGQPASRLPERLFESIQSVFERSEPKLALTGPFRSSRARLSLAYSGQKAVLPMNTLWGADGGPTQ